jgi:hypothetical protein
MYAAAFRFVSVSRSISVDHSHHTLPTSRRTGPLSFFVRWKASLLTGKHVPAEAQHYCARPARKVKEHRAGCAAGDP